MSSPDLLEIINGPEDGTEFPISRAPVILGSDFGCAVNVRLDEDVQSLHARLTAVSDGYRVRKLRGGVLKVNGKNAGVIRSRILREGDILRAGNTELYLRCAADGLAKRSRGLPTENDVAWCLRVLGGKLWELGWWTGHFIAGRSRYMRFLLVMFIIALIAGFLRPNLASELRHAIFGAYQTLGRELAPFIRDLF